MATFYWKWTIIVIFSVSNREELVPHVPLRDGIELVFCNRQEHNYNPIRTLGPTSIAPYKILRGWQDSEASIKSELLAKDQTPIA
jgi:hypothetical protein